MKYGLSSDELDYLYKNLIIPLQELGAHVFLFGSRATGKFKQFSDIDLFYVSNRDGKVIDQTAHGLLRKIEDSSFPYKIDFANYTALARSYLPSIEQDKIEL